jgi:hypothetical protein
LADPPECRDVVEPAKYDHASDGELSMLGERLKLRICVWWAPHLRRSVKDSSSRH